MTDIFQTRIKRYLYTAKVGTRLYRNTRIFAPGFHRGPHAATTFHSSQKTCRYTLVRYFARHIDRASTGCVRLRTSAGYFPKLVKEKIKDRSISIRLAPSILIPVPLPPPRAAFVFPSCVYPANNVYARVLWYAGCKARTRLRPLWVTDCGREHLSLNKFSLLHTCACTWMRHCFLIKLYLSSRQIYKWNKCLWQLLCITESEKLIFAFDWLWQSRKRCFYTMCIFKVSILS